MAKTLREILSELATDVRALNLDDRISYRYLASKFNSKLSYYLRLEFKSREFIKQQSIWKPLSCIKLQQVDLGCCGFIDKCSTLLRSVDPIPEAFVSNYGILLKILTIDSRREFKLISNSSEYKDYTTRRWSGNIQPCYLENKYLYIPDLNIDAVRGLIIPINPFDVDKCNGKLTSCSSPLDAEIPYPDYLIKLAKQEIYNELLNRHNVVEDEKGDDNTNIKN